MTSLRFITYNTLYSALPHLVLLVLVGDFERLCGADHGLHRRVDVLVDQLGEAALVFVRVAGAMDDAHLFDKCALAALSRTYIKGGEDKRSGFYRSVPVMFIVLYYWFSQYCIHTSSISRCSCSRKGLADARAGKSQ